MRLRLISSVVVAALAVACGSEGAQSPTSSPSEPSPTQSTKTTGSPGTTDESLKAAFVAGANAACREYARRSKAQGEFPSSLDGYVRFWKEFIAIGDEVQRKLRALPVPPDDADEIDAYLDLNDRQGAVLRAALPQIEKAARDDDVDTADEVIDAALNEFNKLSAKQDPFTQSYGLVDCGNDTSGASVEA